MPELDLRRDVDLESVNEGGMEGESERGWGSQVALRKSEEGRDGEEYSSTKKLVQKV